MSANHSHGGNAVQAAPSREAQVPIQKEKSPQVLAIASFLRNHKALKLRQGTVNGQPIEFFRYKRCIRALTSQDYQDKTKKLNLPANPELLKNPVLAQRTFIELISNQLLIPVKKLSTQEARKQGFKPTKKEPCFVQAPKCVLADNEYFYWTFTPANPYLPLYSLLGIVGIMTLICFPLWPLAMRRGAWYLSMLALGLIGLLFVVAIIRLIVFIVLSPFTKFWIFPNLFADVGFVDSFIPLYEFEKPKVKSKKASKKSAGSTAAAQIQPPAAQSTGVAKTNGTTVKRKVTLEEVDE